MEGGKEVAHVLDGQPEEGHTGIEVQIAENGDDSDHNGHNTKVHPEQMRLGK